MIHTCLDSLNPFFIRAEVRACTILLPLPRMGLNPFFIRAEVRAIICDMDGIVAES